MSYCRWSSDGGQCDLYCFEHVDGYFAVCVASYRRPRKMTEYDFSSAESLKSTLEQRRRDEGDPTNEREPIGLPYDGEIFQEPDLESMIKRMEMLRDVGYNVPQVAIDAARDEFEVAK